MKKLQAMLRKLPAVDQVLLEEEITALLDVLPRTLILEAIQETLDKRRAAIISAAEEGKELLEGQSDDEALCPSASAVAVEAAFSAEQRALPRLRPLINAAGIVIHTNLGRAPLARSAVEALGEAAHGYTNLEYSLDSGKRGSRHDHLENLLCRLSGAEAAIAVNNNAAAVFLVLQALARGREVIVSRGELVEIGGSFRIPEIMAASGARLVEVGTTNKTYLRDYEAAITPETAAILKVHTSNYHLVGFTAAVQPGELARLAGERGIPLFEDLGSGLFIDTGKYGLPEEPRVQDSIAAGVDLVTFSGDKMLGGPQAGIIVGRAALVSAIRNNQLARAVRVDKFSIAALEATLRLYLDEAKAVREIPVWRMLTAGEGELRQRAERFSLRLENLAHEVSEEGPSRGFKVMLEPGISKVGGGSLPGAELPTTLVVIDPAAGEGGGIGAEELHRRLRLANPPVITRLHREHLLIDLRTVFEDQEETLLQALRSAFKKN